MLHSNKCGRVAQVVEQCPFKAWVAGSNPAALTNTVWVKLPGLPILAKSFLTHAEPKTSIPVRLAGSNSQFKCQPEVYPLCHLRELSECSTGPILIYSVRSTAFLASFCGFCQIADGNRRSPLKRRRLQILVKHEFTLREKCRERETESKRIDKLRSLLLRKRAEELQQDGRKVDLHNIQKVAPALGV